MREWPLTVRIPRSPDIGVMEVQENDQLDIPLRRGAAPTRCTVNAIVANTAGQTVCEVAP